MSRPRPAPPPIRRAITVSWPPERAFRRFTEEFGSWWPIASFSIGADRIARVVFEPRAGGRIFEEHRDGRRFQWGEIIDIDPPRRVRFTWHPARDAASAQDVEVRFVPDGGGTRVELVAAGWERWGDDATVHKARKGYDLGWGYVLSTMAGRRTAGMRALDVMVRATRAFRRWRGGPEAEIASARGEIPPAQGGES
jgi:uncharacterized protein YndB with AHSA1/START domain